MYTIIKRINLTLSILLPALLICSFAYAQDQDHQPADRHWHKAQDLEKRGKYNEAAKYLEEAMTIFKKLGQEDKIATCLSHLGGIYKSVGSYDRAIEYLEEALDRKSTRLNSSH